MTSIAQNPFFFFFEVDNFALDFVGRFDFRNVCIGKGDMETKELRASLGCQVSGRGDLSVGGVLLLVVVVVVTGSVVGQGQWLRLKVGLDCQNFSRGDEEPQYVAAMGRRAEK